MMNYLWKCLSSIEARFPGCGIILLCDFNKTQLGKSRQINNAFKLQQIVNFPTCSGNIVHPVFTNLKEFYVSPIKCPPFGSSDHISVEVQALQCSLKPNTKIVVKSWELRPTNCAAIETYLKEVDVKLLIDSRPTCEGKDEMLGLIIMTGKDVLTPVTLKTIINNGLTRN